MWVAIVGWAVASLFGLGWLWQRSSRKTLPNSAAKLASRHVTATEERAEESTRRALENGTAAVHVAAENLELEVEENANNSGSPAGYFRRLLAGRKKPN